MECIQDLPISKLTFIAKQISKEQASVSKSTALKVLDGCLDVTYISNHMTMKASQQWTDYIYGQIIL